MKAFMDKEFMLQSPVAQHLYHTYAADMPICDYHCHISPKEIYENRRFENITHGEPDKTHFLMFVIRGNAPEADFTQEAKSVLREAGLYA